MSHPPSKDDNPDAPSNPVNSTNSDHNDDDNDKIILSLMREPYKSIMHAHFRLLGSDKFVGGNEVEKAVAERVLARLLSSRNGGGDAVASAAGDSKMKLYKLIRYGKGAIESVDHDWAFHKIRLDLFRRNESTNQWIDAPDNEVNDDDLLAISREEYEELKKNEVHSYVDLCASSKSKGTSAKKSKQSEAKKKPANTALESKVEAQTKNTKKGTSSPKGKSSPPISSSTKSNEIVATTEDLHPAPKTQPTNLVSSAPSNHKSVSSSPTSTEIVLSLRQEPYKSIMYAHFRLFGPNRFTGGSNVEKAVGQRVMDRIVSGDYHDGNVGEVKLYKLSRSGNDSEEISHSVALRKVIQDLNRRGETHNAWMGASESNDDDLLAIKRMEFREMKRGAANSDWKGSSKPKGSSSPQKTKDASPQMERPSSTKSDASAKKNVPAPPKSEPVRKKVPTPPKSNSTKSNKSIALSPSKRSTKVVLSLREEPYKSILSAHFRLFGPERFTGGSVVEKAVGESIMEKIISGGYHEGVVGEVTLYKMHRSGNEVEEVSHSVALRKIIQDLNRRKETYKSWRGKDSDDSLWYAIAPKKFKELKKQAMRHLAGPNGNDSDSEDADSSMLQLESSTGSKPRRGQFPKVVHDMITEHPRVLCWNDAGDGFFIEDENELASILGQYFRSSVPASFMKQLNHYGWKKMGPERSYYHPLFSREMEFDEAVLEQFHPQRKAATSSRQPDQTDTSALETVSTKRAAFRNACGVIKGITSKRDDEKVVLKHVGPGRPRKHPRPEEARSNTEPPTKRRVGRPRKHPYITPDTEASQKMKRQSVAKPTTETPLQAFKRLKLNLKTSNRPPLSIEAMDKQAEDMLSLEYAYQSTYAARPCTPTEPEVSDWQIDNPLDILADVTELSSGIDESV